MKLLLILGVLLLGVWLWRSGRRRDESDEPQAPRAPDPAAQPQPMIRCALCSVHLPGADAVEGKNGWYCCADHRRRAEA